MGSWLTLFDVDVTVEGGRPGRDHWQGGEVESVAETDSELGDGNVVCTTVYRAVKAKPGVWCRGALAGPGRRKERGPVCEAATATAAGSGAGCAREKGTVWGHTPAGPCLQPEFVPS